METGNAMAVAFGENFNRIYARGMEAPTYCGMEAGLGLDGGGLSRVQSGPRARDD